MNLLILCDEYPPGPHGGIGTTVQTIARNFVKSGHKVIVAGVYCDNYPGEYYSEDFGVIVYRKRIKSGRFTWIKKRLVEYKLVKQLCQKYQIDIIEGTDWQGPFAFWPSLNIPIVVRINGSQIYFNDEFGSKLTYLSKLLEKNNLQKADYLIATSEYCAKKTIELTNINKKVKGIIYNPSEAVNLYPEFNKRDTDIVLFSGTLTEKKGIFSLLEAWIKVNKIFPEKKLHIYGKDKANMQESIFLKKMNSLDMKVQRSIILHGHVEREKLLNNLSKACIGVFPSYTETFGYAAVESMLHGCATIYTKLSCGPEILNDGIEGLLVDPNNPMEIADAIIMLLSDIELRKKISYNGFIMSNQRFTVHTAINKNIELYNSFIFDYNENKIRLLGNSE